VPTNLLVYKGAIRIPLLDGGVRLAQLSLSPVVVFKLPAITNFLIRLSGSKRPAALLSAFESISSVQFSSVQF
jgi:hypothetical protein